MQETWTIKYTSKTDGVSWHQGRYAQRDMADLNARLCNALGHLTAEVVPY
jgi:hypothetical protein